MPTDKNKKAAFYSCFQAVRTRLELATPGVTGRYSNQLNYRTIHLVPKWDCKYRG